MSESEGSGDEALELPRATVQRIAKAAVPGHAVEAAVISSLVKCCGAFVSRVSVVASAKRSLIQPEDVANGCASLGFAFQADLEAVDEEETARHKATKLRKSAQSAIPDEEKARLQELLFADAAKSLQTQK